MFAQMMKFQMESQQKKRTKNLQKRGKTPSTSVRKQRKNLKKRGKTTTSERKRRKNLKKTRKNNNGSSLNYKNSKKHFLKVLVITRLQIVLLFSLKMQCGTHSKHFSTPQMRIRPLRHITEDMKISILPTVPIGLMQKMSGYFYES